MTRVAAFNVENLFSRAKAINFARHENGDIVLATIAQLVDELDRAVAIEGLHHRLLALAGGAERDLDVAAAFQPVEVGGVGQQGPRVHAGQGETFPQARRRAAPVLSPRPWTAP